MPHVLIQHWLPDREFDRLRHNSPDAVFLDGRDPAEAEKHFPEADILYGAATPAQLVGAARLRWIQLASAGVPANLCAPAKQRGIRVTNLAGLYGPTIAEHAIAMMLVLSRNLHVVQNQQRDKKWDRTVRETMRDLRGQRTAGSRGDAVPDALLL